MTNKINIDKKSDDAVLTVGVFKSYMDEFALAIKGGFDKVDEKFTKIDERFSKIDDRFSKIDSKLKGMDARIIGINNRLDYHSEVYVKKADRVGV